MRVGSEHRFLLILSQEFGTSFLGHSAQNSPLTLFQKWVKVGTGKISPFEKRGMEADSGGI
jgi:hypothetical protein